MSRAPALALGLAVSLAAPLAAAGPLRVGSKRFTESYILAELAASAARGAGEPEVTHVEGLGGTAIAFRALEQGQIDLYPEYTGTIAEVVLHLDRADLAALRQALAPRGIGVGEPLGFENTYALAVTEKLARSLGLARVSDLKAHPELRFGLSNEFLGRRDGWPGLSARYRLAPASVTGLDHGLAYGAVEQGSIDVMDVYSTDAKIKKYALRTLDDDLGYFPSYQAVFLYREAAQALHPRGFSGVWALSGTLSARAMIDLNGRVELEGRSFREAADEQRAGKRSEAPRASPSLLRGLLSAVRAEGPTHLFLAGTSLFFAVLAGLPLGVLASRSRLLASIVLSITGVVQTIPSLALLCFFIPVFGTGALPAIVALFLYSLLPIVRNTLTGLTDIPGQLRESAEALGLPPLARLVRVELPMASRSILGGIKTAAVINVGTATLAAFIGAGGFGQPISTGLNLNDNRMILEGAIPAAALALLVQALFDALDRVLIPRGLRLSGGEAAR